jgi:hypothetical protein
MRQRADRARLRRFLHALGQRVRRPVRLYLVGGSVMIDLGLRVATLDIDYEAQADDPEALAELEQAIRVLKNELDVNVEPASPGDFLPVLPHVYSYSRYVGRFGQVSVYYYHLASMVVAKAARAYEQDLDDAERLLTTGEVSWQEVADTWREMRTSPTGWLRYEPDDIERRLNVLRTRIGGSAL